MNRSTADLKAIIAAEFKLPIEQLDDELTLEAVGFDSLQATEIILAIEKQTGREVNAPAIAGQLHRDMKLGELLILLASDGSGSVAETNH
jgi:acyl carrier protein